MTKAESDVLKGLSIIFVVLIHALAIFKPEVWLAGSSLSLGLIVTDQLARVCIPLFILISWYGLAKKYEGKPFKPGIYLWERVSKLLPLYLLWSLVLYWLLPLTPNWEFAPHLPLVTKLLLGQADYHFYFVPLIMLMYLLFPLFQSIPRRWYGLATILIFSFQLTWFWWLATLSPDTRILGFQPDQWQYLLPLSWIWYGWLGLLLARTKLEPLMTGVGLRILIGVLSLGALILTVNQTQHYILQTGDILGGLKFTRWPILGYTTLMSVWLIALAAYKKGQVFTRLEKIGSASFLIYLVHPMVIRLLTYPFDPAFSWSTLIIGLSVTSVVSLVSWWLMKFQ